MYICYSEYIFGECYASPRFWRRMAGTDLLLIYTLSKVLGIRMQNYFACD